MRRIKNYDFSSGHIKHKIEEQFYQLVGKYLPKLMSSTIVTGPNYQRHINNFNKYINRGSLKICEIDIDIFTINNFQFFTGKTYR